MVIFKSISNKLILLFKSTYIFLVYSNQISSLSSQKNVKKMVFTTHFIYKSD